MSTIAYVAVPQRTRYSRFAEVRFAGNTIANLYGTSSGDPDLTDFTFMTRAPDYSNPSRPVKSVFCHLSARSCMLDETIRELAMLHGYQGEARS